MAPGKEDTETVTVASLASHARERTGPIAGKAWLVVIYGGELGRRVALDAISFVVGRSSTSDLTLNEDSVSRHHVRISRQPDKRYILTDLGSTNGTYVNDESVQERLLGDGDKIKIGQTIFKFMTGADVEASYHEEIYRLMTVDGLTDVFNKRYFHEALEREFKRWQRYRRPLSLLLFDIDHFKQKNDAFGHVAGDSILRQMAASVKPRLRNEDIFGRVGGEEFGILLPEIDKTHACVTAEKVRALVEETCFSFDGVDMPCTVSVGVTEVIGADERAEAVYVRADQALYEAKRRGRNQIFA